MRKPTLKPSGLSREELLERRVSDLERMQRRLPVRSVAGGAAATTFVVNKTAHGLAVKDVVRHNGTSWTKSQADTAANAVVGGMVIAVLSPDVFIVATPGSYVSGLSSLTAGAVHYLDASTAGALTTTAPTIAVPVLHADSATSGVLMSAWPSGSAFEWLSIIQDSVLTGSGTYTPPSGVSRLLVIGIGAGAGVKRSTGSITATGLYVAGSSGGTVNKQLYQQDNLIGGNAGNCVQMILDIDSSFTFDYACGSGGSAGAAGGDTTITFLGSVTYTVKGGGTDGPNPQAPDLTLTTSAKCRLSELIALVGGMSGDGYPVLNHWDGTNWTLSYTGRPGPAGYPPIMIDSNEYGRGAKSGSGAKDGAVYVYKLA